MLYNKLKIIYLFLLLICNYSYSQSNKSNINFPKYTSSEKRSSGYEKRLEIENSSIVKNISFRNIGPTVMSGRVSDLEVNPQDPSHFYVAYASGGLWETTNNGNSFNSIFDNQMVMTIGDINVDWINNIIYVGTGEKNSSRSSYSGNGIYRSIDNGDTWEHLGLDESHHIGRIILHPNDKNILWVASLGHLYSSNKDRGLYKSMDGGKTWENKLFINDMTGGIDLVMHPTNSDIIYCAMWERERKAWDFNGSGKGSGIYKSSDAGETWLEISGSTSGFPDSEGTGRIGLDISKSNPNMIYAILDNQERKPKVLKTKSESLTKDDLRTISTNEFLKISNEKIDIFLKENRFPSEYKSENIKKMVENGSIDPISLVEFLEDSNTLLFETPVIGAEVYLSEDSGKSWKKVNTDELNNLYYSYGYYFGEIRVDPQNSKKVYVLGVPLLKSDDGGKTWNSIDFENMHGDHQALWINPKKSGHLIAGNDGGLNISYDDGKNWSKHNSTSVGQFYDINIDMNEPYNIYGGFQDNGVWMGPSNYQASLGWHSSGQYPWKSIYGGDGMQTEVDFRDNNTVYTGSQFGNYARLNISTGERKRITPVHKLGERPYRWNWESPIYLSRHNQDILYMGSNKFHRSVDQGNNFETLSEDLTKGGKKGNVSYGTLTSIIESNLKYGLIYVGSDDGLIHVSKDAGYSWNQISNSLPQDMWVSSIYPSNFIEGRVYLSLNGYRWDNFESMIYVSEDYGLNWSKIGHNLPKEPVNIIIEDPKNERLIYVGTDHGVYASLDYGNSFSAFREGLPNAPVHDLVVHPRENELVVGTHGRSVYIGDVSYLQKLTKKTMSKPVHIFKQNSISYSSRWGSKNWNGNVIEPNLDFVIYSDKLSEINLYIEKDDKVLISEKLNADIGINYISSNLFSENINSYLNKGKYKVLIVSGKDSDEIFFNIK